MKLRFLFDEKIMGVLNTPNKEAGEKLISHFIGSEWTVQELSKDSRGFLEWQLRILDGKVYEKVKIVSSKTATK